MSLIEKAAAKLKKNESLVERAAKKMAKPAEGEEKKDSAAAESAPAAASSTTSESSKTAQAPAEKKPSRKQSRRVEIDMEHLKKQNILVVDGDHSQISEEFRIVKRSLLLNAFAKGEAAIPNGNIIMVTSTQPEEGKTFCAISLAMSMAMERDLTVLLVDADVAKADVLKRMGLKAEKGLIDVIEDETLDLADCLLRTNVPNLSLLPAGKKHKLTTELLASERMGELIDEIAKRYPDRVVIVDSPPVLANSSASVLALRVGQVLYIVEADRTREEELKEALSMISSCEHINLLLNKSRFSSGKKKFSSYYGYGYN
tara:strand:- start:597 stop:1541 length:945 start_codon:yes stop_codon:yes gene_type:complete